MGAETELKLRITAADARKVARLGILRGIKPLTRRLENIYYDTPDDELSKRRIALRHRRIGDDWLITVKCAAGSVGGLATRAEWEYPCPRETHDFSGVDDKAMREFLESIQPRLIPMYSTDFKRRAWMIEPHQDLSIELALDEGEITARPPGQAPGSILSRPIRELEFELKKGHPLALFEVAIHFAGKLALMPENESKAQRGQRLYRRVADAPMPSSASRIHAEQSPLAAFRQLAHECLDHFLANAEGVRVADEAEYIHQARVALRRLRALLRVFAPLLPERFAPYNDAWRHFANQLGDARDHDVLVEETLPEIARHYDGHDAIEVFTTYAQSRREEAHETARASFHSPALGLLTLRFLADLARLEGEIGGEEAPSLKRFARRRLKKILKAVRQHAADTSGQSIDDLHRLRIRFKRLRYALEFFAPLLPEGRTQAYLGEVKVLQDQLGRINDLERALAVEAGAPDSTRCDLAAGWLSASQQALIQALPDIARRFLARPPPWEKVVPKPFR